MKTKHGQSLFDIVIQETGDIKNAFLTAFENNIGLTDDVETGQEIKIPLMAEPDIYVKNIYKSRGLEPATGFLANLDEGIEFWIVENDLIIN